MTLNCREKYRKDLIYYKKSIIHELSRKITNQLFSLQQKSTLPIPKNKIKSLTRKINKSEIVKKDN